jgi:hypothetical protein
MVELDKSIQEQESPLSDPKYTITAYLNYK